MSTGNGETYQEVLQRAANQLGLSGSRDLEPAIIDHCLNQLRDWLLTHGEPETLSQLVDRFAMSLDVRFEEVRGPADMDALLNRMEARERPTFAALRSEFGDDTDAATVLRVNRQPWEPAYLAVINCEGWHEFRRYFSKWHELAHRLLEGSQLTFALRQTKVERAEPEEILVDKVAAALAFFPDMFLPVFVEECTKEGGLTFAAVERVRERIAPDASREATLRASLHHTDTPAWFLRCSMGFTADERRNLNSAQMRLIPDDLPEAKLRIIGSSWNPAATALDIRFHRNMRVPDTSAVTEAFHDEQGAVMENVELLDDWETRSGGPIGSGAVRVEAARIDAEEVWALIQLLDPEDGT